MKEDRRADVTIVETDERLDATRAPKLKERLKKLGEEREAKLVVDMAKTMFIDSSGCGALVAALKSIVKNGGDMKIAQPTPQALTLFQLTRLDKVFEIHSTLEGALESFA